MTVSQQIAEEETHRSSLAGKTPRRRPSDTMPEQLDGLKRLFQKMNTEEPINFLDVMAAISEMVAFYTDCDIDTDIADIEKFFMSQKKCRFCS